MFKKPNRCHHNRYVVANNTNRGQNNSMCVDSDQNPQDIHYQEKVHMPKKSALAKLYETKFCEEWTIKRPMWNRLSPQYNTGYVGHTRLTSPGANPQIICQSNNPHRTICHNDINYAPFLESCSLTCYHFIWLISLQSWFDLNLFGVFISWYM